MRKTLMAASVLALVAGSASAATVSYTDTYNIAGPATGSTTIAGFSGAGTFVSALYTLTYTTEVNGTVTNLDASGTATVDVFATNYKTTPPVPSNVSGTIADNFGFGFDSTSFTLAGGASQGYMLQTSAVRNGALTEAQTAADFALGYTLFSGSTATTSGTSVQNIFAAISNLKIDVEYTYETTAVPVPAALPLLATAFGALGVMRLRRKA